MHDWISSGYRDRRWRWCSFQRELHIDSLPGVSVPRVDLASVDLASVDLAGIPSWYGYRGGRLECGVNSRMKYSIVRYSSDGYRYIWQASITPKIVIIVIVVPKVARGSTSLGHHQDPVPAVQEDRQEIRRSESREQDRGYGGGLPGEVVVDDEGVEGAGEG